MDDISGNIDQQLQQAYLSTTYEVQPVGLKIHIGVPNLALEEFLVDNNVFSWAFISAYNPRSKVLSLEENEKRHLRFVTEVEQLRIPYMEGFGVPQNEDWSPEKSLMVLGVSKIRAIYFGKKLEQNAIVWGRLGGISELVWLR